MTNQNKVIDFIKNILKNTPNDWINLTTHRLDIYNEKLAKTEFIQEFEKLYHQNISSTPALEKLPTAYDYIRLGHPLSSVLEWTIAKLNRLKSDQVISFSSQTMPILAVLRKNLLNGRPTQIVYNGELPKSFDADLLRKVYNYQFDIKKIESNEDIPKIDGSTILVSNQADFKTGTANTEVDFNLSIDEGLGSILIINSKDLESYISAIQHVRRRETIAMTPANCYTALKEMAELQVSTQEKNEYETNKEKVLDTLKNITATHVEAVLGSSGLSVQYAIMMGLIHEAIEQHPDKAIKIIVPPNCYGGTNDQARRVAESIKNVEILDLPVDGENDMVSSTEKVLAEVARINAVPFIIAEIPTNPRVEVPNLEKLRDVLSEKRKTPTGETAVDPVFILDQTFCPNVQFLSEEGILAVVRTISYVSGSKFPSGGKCTAGYCTANNKAADLMINIKKHLILCDNEATPHQVKLLAEQLPSMNSRITEAYKNTREFVNFIEEKLPAARINFVSEELAEQGFTPSVFSLDLPTKGSTEEERETYKRELNHKLIDMMISQIPNESKYCVSYGQLKGCYWTIPATSTQGTTKESDKDYIARVSVSPNLDLARHKEVFLEFVKEINF